MVVEDWWPRVRVGVEVVLLPGERRWIRGITAIGFSSVDVPDVLGVFKTSYV